MDYKFIQKKLQNLRDRIAQKGQISESDEKELKSLIHDTLLNANDQLENIQGRLHTMIAKKAGNDNALNEEQKAKLDVLQKAGAGSTAVH